MLQPDLTIRSNITPYAQLTAVNYKQTSPSGVVLPVVLGENSDDVFFRIYNNFALNTGIATALNVKLTTFDGAGSSSRTSVKSVVGQQWINLAQQGYGESSATPGVFTYWETDSVPVGGLANVFLMEKGSDGVAGQRIRAGSNTNGCGFIEFKSFAQLPVLGQAGNYTFAIAVEYEYVP